MYRSKLLRVERRAMSEKVAGIARQVQPSMRDVGVGRSHEDIFCDDEDAAV